jgi:DNA-3-methyladenine glycosylase II
MSPTTFDPDKAARGLSRRDPVLRRLIKRVGPCTLNPAWEREPYEALVRAIAYQQLHGSAAAKILGRFIALVPDETFPSPASVLRLSEEAMRSAGLSGNKILAIKDIARHADDGKLPDRSGAMVLCDDDLITRLVAIRGVGRWTVEMMLISTLGRMDVLPVDDYGVRMGYKIAANLDEAPKPKQLAEIGQAWSPYRSIAAWYFWRAVDLAKVQTKS